ncbi:MAG: GvpL/GvpF family gas vesicle protein [Pseudomonadota bacterium]
MTVQSLIGIIPQFHAANIPNVLAGQMPEVVCRGDLAAITLPAVGQSRLSSAKRRLTARLSQLQVSLETLARTGPILAAALDQHFETRSQVEQFLDGNAQALHTAMQRHGDQWQFQIEINWKPEEALAMLASRRAIQPDSEDPKALADAMQRAMKTERQRLASAMATILHPAATELAMLPTQGETEVARYLALIDSDGEAALDQAVEAVDALAPDFAPNLFQIRYLGPLPATSFACVARTMATDDDLARAAKTIGMVDHSADAAQIKSAFREYCKLAHPDGGPADPSSTQNKDIDLQAAKQARDLLMCAAAMRATRPMSDQPAILPLLDLRRDENLQTIIEAA